MQLEKPISGKFPWRKFRNWWRGEMADRALAESVPFLTHWFSHGCGQELLESEQQMLDDIHQQFIDTVRQGRGARLKETP